MRDFCPHADKLFLEKRIRNCLPFAVIPALTVIHLVHDIIQWVRKVSSQSSQVELYCHSTTCVDI